MGIRLEQGQKQIISQQMIQSVKILQMSAAELTEYIKEASLENPVIDFVEASPLECEITPTDQERLKRLEWLDRMDEQNRIYYQSDHEDDDDDRGFSNLSGRNAERLEDSLRMQLLGKGYTPLQQDIFTYIIHCLDSRGYFTYPTSEIARVFHVPESEAQSCLEIMRGLEPAGICAASVQQCLLRQLEQDSEDTALERAIILEHMELLGKNQLHVIAKLLGADLSDVTRAADQIRQLNPRPAQGFDDGEPVRYVIPDITILKQEDRFEIQLTDHTCPALHINREYLRLLQSDCGKEVKDYLTKKMQQAEELQSCISRRGSTLMSLAACILEVQKQFFLTGQNTLQPFRLAEAAELVGCNKSTISRAAKDKYLQCCWGVYPLSFFFPKGLSSDGNSEAMSVRRIKQELADIIADESKQKPYSDAKLADIMNTRGIGISRRTVAKYREEMNIPNCRGRKQYP